MYIWYKYIYLLHVYYKVSLGYQPYFPPPPFLSLLPTPGDVSESNHFISNELESIAVPNHTDICCNAMRYTFCAHCHVAPIGSGDG